jgi:hypothetical protein
MNAPMAIVAIDDAAKRGQSVARAAQLLGVEI